MNVARVGITADQLRGILSANDLDHRDPRSLERLDVGGQPAELRAALHAYKRIGAVHADLAVRERILGLGFASANSIAQHPENVFVERYTEALNVPPSEARAIHRRAVRIQNTTHQLFANVKSAVSSPYFRASRANAVSAELQQYFEQLSSYQDIFGSLDYCRCDECGSIFGAAAYLVDLLRLVRSYVTTQSIAGLSFAERRPDIAKIELTCAKTNDLVPYLQIVNERLASALTTKLNLTEDALFQAMATTLVYPAMLPFNAPLDQIRVLLELVQLPLADVFAAWNVAGGDVARERLGLSREQLTIVTTETTDPAALAAFYGVAQTDLTALAGVSFFLAQTGMTIADINDVIRQGVSDDDFDAGVTKAFYVNQKLGAGYLRIDESTEAPTIVGIPAALDAMNRFRRLCAATGWTPDVADWMLRAAAGGAAPVLDGPHLEVVSALAAAAAALQLTPLQASALFAPLKTYGSDGDGTASPFDVAFNDAATVARLGTYQPAGNALNGNYKTEPLAWTPGSTQSADIAAITRVLRGLGVTLDAVTTLGTALFGPVPTDLTVDALSQLYRHTLLANALGMTIDVYLRFLVLAGHDVTTPAFDATSLAKILALNDALTAMGLDPHAADYVLTGTASVYVDPGYSEDNVANWLTGLQSLVTPEPATVESALDAQIAIFFNDAAGALTTAARRLAVEANPPGQGTWWQEFIQAQPDVAYVKSVLKTISRVLLFAGTANVSADVLASVADQPAAFGITLPVLTWENMRDVAQVAATIAAFGDKRGSLLRFIALRSNGGSVREQLAALQDATGWSPDAVQALLDGGLASESNTAQLLRALRVRFEQMTRLGADVAFTASLAGLSTLAATSWTTYREMADDLFAKINARYDPVTWAAMWGGVDGRLRVRTRDALLALELVTLRATYSDITTFDNVYEFLLIDVESGPEAQISYVKEALNATQLYLQRCRLGLERDVTSVNIPPVWWDWIMNYRKWEANRQIFLYPENYLIPTLRDDQTTLFAQLVSDLQQSDITADTSATAFTSYIDAFQNVTTLNIVESYRCTVDDANAGPTPATFLFGRTGTAPYTFYFCSQADGDEWTEWQKINLTVPSPVITPVYAFNQLFIFWLELKSTPSVSISVDMTTGGQSYASRTYTATISYSYRDHTGNWLPPQALLSDDVVFYTSQQYPDVVPGNPEWLFDGVFDDLQSELWLKLYALRVDAANCDPGLTMPAEGERIVLSFSPLLRNTAAQAGDIAPAGTPNAQFVAKLRRAAHDHNRSVIAAVPALTFFRDPIVIDENLTPTFIGHRTEYLAFDSYRPNIAGDPAFRAPLSTFVPEISSADPGLRIVRSPAPLTDGRQAEVPAAIAAPAAAVALTGAEFVSPTIPATAVTPMLTALGTAGVLDGQQRVVSTAMSTLNLYTALQSMLAAGTISPMQFIDIERVLLRAMGSASLFGNAGSDATRLITVKNQPGWFVLAAPSETFLFRPEQPAGGQTVFSSLQDGLFASQPLLNPMSFAAIPEDPTGAGNGFNATRSAEALAALQGFQLVDNRGVVDTGALMFGNDPANIVQAALGNMMPKVTTNQIVDVAHIMLNTPLVSAATFSEGSAISDGLAQKVFTKLQNLGLIDYAGRVETSAVTMQMLYTLLLDLIVPSQQLTQRDVALIYQRLLQSPTATSLTYWNAPTATSTDDISAQRFDVVRLSTGAIGPLARALSIGGIPRLLALRMQQTPVVPVLPFSAFAPSANVNWPQAIDGAQPDYDGLYGRYFWELFYHAPMLVANMLSTSGRFQDAIGWFQYVFDPTVQPNPVTAQTFVDDSAGVIPLAQATKVLQALQANPPPPATPLVEDGFVDPAFGPTTDLSFIGNNILPANQLPLVRSILLNHRLATANSRFWQFQPFRTHTLASLFEILTDGSPAMKAYANHPFDPFAIARLRIGAFEKATLMQYIDVLTDWGDFLFTQDTWESITAATMLYVYASDLLGPRPQVVGDPPQRDALTFEQIAAMYDLSGTAQDAGTQTITLAADASPHDRFYTACTCTITAGAGAGDTRVIVSYDGTTRVATVSPPWDAGSTPAAGSTYHVFGIPPFLIDLEDSLPQPRGDDPRPPINVRGHAFNDLGTYFCVPENATFAGYWDRVEDRLDKIRESRNIRGQFRLLALFEPPLDPLALIRAALAGNNVPQPGGPAGNVPPLRFAAMLERARSLTATAQQLGDQILSVLERKNGEQLAQLQNTQEAKVLSLTTAVKQQQIADVQATLLSLQAQATGAQDRLTFYNNAVAAGLSANESANLDHMLLARNLTIAAGVLNTAASIGYAVPQAGSPFAMTYGGQQLGSVLTASSGVLNAIAEDQSFQAQRALTNAGYERRTSDWQLQATIATQELASINAQITGSQASLAMAQQDLKIHQTTIANNAAIAEYLHDKFTNEQLYGWMAGALSALYFQTYQLALSASVAAQQSYQFETGATDTFVNFDYFDGTRKGMTAGAGLRFALDQLESAYDAKNTRKLEIERTVSLGLSAPQALLDLRSKGTCEFELSEALFDYDYPGHYQRQIKAVSVSIPAVLGPYQELKAILTQTYNAVVLTSTGTDAVKYLLTRTGSPGSALRENWAPSQQIAISRGVDDSGLFVLDFNDERYLPFEGTGAVSKWTLSIPLETNRFDFARLSDVIVTVRYTALADDELKKNVTAMLKQVPLGGGFFIDVAQSYAQDWFAFMQDASPDSQTLRFTFTSSVFGHFRSATLDSVTVGLTLAPVKALPSTLSTFMHLTIAGAAEADLAMVAAGNDQPNYAASLTSLDEKAPKFEGEWQLRVDLKAMRSDPDLSGLLVNGRLDPAQFVSLQMLMIYEGTVF